MDPVAPFSDSSLDLVSRDYARWDVVLFDRLTRMLANLELFYASCKVLWMLIRLSR